jgi:hypothetical protein
MLAGWRALLAGEVEHSLKELPADLMHEEALAVLGGAALVESQPRQTWLSASLLRIAT